LVAINIFRTGGLEDQGSGTFLAAGTRSAYRKVRARRSWDFAFAGVALALRFEGRQVADARVFLSEAVPVPWRSPKVDKAIRGQELTSSVIAAASKTAAAATESLAQSGYKPPMFQGVIEE
jgi:xanthine dehydrogenase YagS FAD-binding subunit